MHDQPLTVADLARPGHGIPALAERIAPHLGPRWHARIERRSAAVMLSTDDGLELRLYYSRISDAHEMAVTAHGPGGWSLVPVTMSLFALPSRLASQITTEVLPGYRRQIDRDRDAKARKEAAQQAQRGHAQAVADRLGTDWEVREGTYSVRVERPRKKARVFGEIHWSRKDGSMYVDLHNLPAELVEHLVDGIEAHMRRHEIDESAALRKRPKRLNYLLELMVAAGYRIDKLGPEHEALFGRPMFKMGLRVAPGDDLVSYVLERQDRLDRAIRVLETRPEEG